MATDFFQRQSDARRSTTWLVVLFLLAVVGIVAVAFLAAAWAVDLGSQYHTPAAYGSNRFERSPDDNRWAVPMMAGLGSLGVILLGSLYKIGQLRGGGAVVAENLGGRRVLPNTTDFVERRLLNVVEEMALASGVPVPPVFLLAEEQGINAFAAGYSPSDAVVTVTRGTAEQLSREQLQGVVAHEFSHILNGDMRLNVRLIGVLYGILLLGLIGQLLLRIAATSSRSRSKNNPAAFFILVGLALLVLGFVGTLMGNLIKAAVSRQRESLADASAVQFTRNPLGLAGALKRIGGWIQGSILGHANAAEASHLYFSKGVRGGLASLLDSHPPLAERIRQLDPQWDGKFPASPATAAVYTEAAPETAGLVGAPPPIDAVPRKVVEQSAQQVGDPTEVHRQYAAEILETLPEELLAAVREPYGARAVLFALLLDRDKAVRTAQMSALTELAALDIVQLTAKLTPAVDQLDPGMRLPLVNLSLPALRTMSPAQYREFSRCFQRLVQADHRVDLFEWMLHRVLLRHLRPQFEPIRPTRTAYYNLRRLAKPCSVLLSTLAYAGNSGDAVRAALAKAAAHLPEVAVTLLPQDQCGLVSLDQALNQLMRVSVKHRKRLVDACAAAVCADDLVKVREAELLRGVCDMLDCPLPPLLPQLPADR